MDTPLPDMRRHRWLRRSLLILGAVLVLLTAGLAIAERHLKGVLLHALTARTGHVIRVDGAFQAHLLSLRPSITASQVSIGNPPWMPAGMTAQLATVAVGLEWQASLHPLGIRHLELQGATLHLLRDASGQANWRAHPGGPGKGPPLIKSLSMSDARVEFRDERRHLQFTGIVSAGDAGEGATPELRVDGAGQLNGRPFSFDVTGDSLATVRRDHPYDFVLQEHSGSDRLSLRGAITQPFDLRVLQGSFDAAGPDLENLYFLVGIRLPETGPYQLSGRLARQGMRFAFSDVRASFGESEVKGSLSTDDSSGRPRLEGELSSERLRLADIGAQASGRAPEPSANPGLRFAQTPFHLDGIERTDALVSFRVRELQLTRESIRSLSGVVSLDHAVLSIELSKAALGEGTVSGSARFDASRKVPRGELSLSVTDVPLEQFKGKGGGEPPFTGLLSGRARLSGEGKSPHELAATANGTITAVIPHGAMRTSIADLAALDLTGALGAVLKDRKETAMHCGVAGFDAHDGLVTTHIFVIDTDEVLITGTGTLHMDSETLDLALHGRPKKAGLALRSAISINGTLMHPQAHLGGHGAAAQSGAAALSVILTPIAAVLGFVNPGLARDADCASLIAQASAAAGAPVLHGEQPAK
jgi:uncharacterized protein involved in outer membrane biogenesis